MSALPWRLSCQLFYIAMLAALGNLHPILSDDSMVPLSNGEFDLGPPLNSTVQEVEVSSLPGWTVSGTVQYIHASGNITLPGQGSAVQLGRDSQISQAFSAARGSVYALTFTLASAGENCSTADLLSVSVPSSQASASFMLSESYSEKNWETRAWGFIAMSSQENLTFANLLSKEAVQQDPNITCGPVMDTVYLKKMITTNRTDAGNLLVNGGFEDGPYLLSNSSYGVLLDEIVDASSSPLPGWTVGSTVRYIDAGHYLIPEGRAAVELVGGPGASLEQLVNLSSGANYILTFRMGDGKDLCAGNMTVAVTAGESTENFTFNSVAKGQSDSYSMKFQAVSESTNISIVNLLRNEDENSFFCGPVVDNVSLSLSPSGCLSTLGGSRSSTSILILCAILAVILAAL